MSNGWRILKAVEAFDRRTRALDRIVPPPGVTLPPRLLDAVPKLSPMFEAPRALEPIAEVLEAAPRGALKVCIAAPPRWGKTELVIHAFAHWLRRDPRLALMLVQHTAALALSKSTRARSLAIRAGVRLAPDSRAKSEWLTTDGGGLRAFGFDAGIIGHGCDVLVVDDPFAKLSEVASQANRDRVFEDFRGSLMSRLEPDGSAIIIAQRLHEDDLTGRAIRELGFDYVKVTPRDEHGRSRWPSRFSDEKLSEIETLRGPFLWQTQYLGEPARPDDALFRDPTYYDPHEFPLAGPTSIGCDISHTSKDRSDPNGIAAMRRGSDGRYYVLDARSKKAPLTDEGTRRNGFVRELRALQERLDGARIYMFAGGNAEPLVIKLLGQLPPDQRVVIHAWRADADKRSRALPLAADYAAGRVVFPRNVPWAEKAISHLQGFTGQKGGDDDLTDALVAAHAALRSNGPRGRARGTGDGGVMDRLGGVVAA